MIEVLKQALEALELNNDEWKSLADSGDAGYWRAEDQDHYKQTNKAITAIKAALAQPEQEPVAFAGVEMWIGNTRIKKLMTQTELHSAIDPWAIVKFNSDSCIDALKEKNT
jgi:hypothetical protein